MTNRPLSSSTPGPMYDKYIVSPASPPWQATVGLRFASGQMADLDGDGYEEVVTTVPDPTGLQAPSLGVLSYFNYATMAAEWKSAPYQTQLVATALTPILSAPASVAPTAVIRTGYVVSATQASTVILDFLILTLVTWEAYSGYQSTSLAASQIQSANGKPGFFITPDTTFFLADIDGDGYDEFILYDGSETMAIAKWTSTGSGTTGSLQCLWVGNSVYGVTPDMGWSVLPGTSLWVAPLMGGTTAQVLVLDSNLLLSLLQWSDGYLEVLWQSYTIPATGSSSLPLVSDTQFYVGDLDGDGTNEIVAYNPGLLAIAQLGVLRWSAADSQIELLDATNILKGYGPFDFASIMVAPVSDASMSSILALDNTPQLLTIGWSASAGFTLMGHTGTTLDAGAAADGWTFATDNLFALADVDGDGVKELIVESDSSAAMALLKYTSDGWQVLWYAPSGISTKNSLQTWGINLLLNAPSTALPVFTGDALSVYNGIAVNLGLSPTLPNGVRFEYANFNEVGKYTYWAGLLNDQVTTPTWTCATDYPDAYVAVFNQISWELTSITTIYGFFENLTTNLGLISAHRQDDLAPALANLVLTPAPDAQVSYWPGAFLVATLVGLAALPLGPEVQIAAAVAASLMGSLLAAPSSSTGIAEPSLINYVDLYANIGDENGTAVSAAEAQINVFCFDSVKLVFLNPLLSGPWATGAFDYTAVAAAMGPYDRLATYQMLMPVLFQVEEWMQTQAAAPWILTASSTYPGPAYLEEALDTSGSSGGLTVTGDNPYNLFLLVAANTSIPNPTYPSSALMSDLLDTMGQPIADVLLGASGWNIPQVIYSIGDPTGSATISTQNPGSEQVWITIYMGETDHHLDYGWVEPNSIRTWAAGDYTFGNHYTVRGQWQGQDGGPFDTTISVWPSQVSDGNSATTDCLVIYNKETDSSYWSNGNC